MDILNKIAALYGEKYNSTCIIDTEKLTISNAGEDTIKFKSDMDMINFLLDEMILSGGDIWQ